MHYSPFENKKKLLKYQSAFQMAKWFVFQLTFSRISSGVCLKHRHLVTICDNIKSKPNSRVIFFFFFSPDFTSLHVSYPFPYIPVLTFIFLAPKELESHITNVTPLNRLYRLNSFQLREMQLARSVYLDWATGLKYIIPVSSNLPGLNYSLAFGANRAE